jgi:hypothetical protein
MRFVKFVAIEFPRIIVTENLIVVLSEIFSVKVEGKVIWVSLFVLALLMIRSISWIHLSLEIPPLIISYYQLYEGVSLSLNPDPTVVRVVFLHLQTLEVREETVTLSFLIESHLLVAEFHISDPDIHLLEHYPLELRLNISSQVVHLVESVQLMQG